MEKYLTIRALFLQRRKKQKTKKKLKTSVDTPNGFHFNVNMSTEQRDFFLVFRSQIYTLPTLYFIALFSLYAFNVSLIEYRLWEEFPNRVDFSPIWTTF